MKTIHIFYNGNEANFPESNDWEKFHGHDSVRVFLMTCEGWRRAGWNVKRLITEGDGPEMADYDPLPFTGRVARESKWYPETNWQFIPKACTLAPDEDGEIWFGTYDVPNFGFPPPHQLLKKIDKENTGCISFQREHFSLACFVATSQWLHRARGLLTAYDAENLPRIPGKYTSDETILRAYAEYTLYDRQAFPLADYHRFPLVHLARSTLKQAYETIPVV